tara:strand:+ start:605 stop:838 length:234 start_codon:yes stop_codon:yes gene_type:complete
LLVDIQKSSEKEIDLNEISFFLIQYQREKIIKMNFDTDKSNADFLSFTSQRGLYQITESSEKISKLAEELMPATVKN